MRVASRVFYSRFSLNLNDHMNKAADRTALLLHPQLLVSEVQSDGAIHSEDQQVHE